MRDINHTHLIQAITAYKKGDDRFIVFPWAPKGNLRELWKRQASPKGKKIIPWASNQIKGLIEGLAKLHEVKIRHGDLKPENILVFDAKKHKGMGSLVIADVGVAKYHAFETEERRNRGIETTNRASTLRYEPPELSPHLGDKLVISVKYDSWSIGCVILEFIIWIIYGWGCLVEFNKNLNKDRFWERDDYERPVLHREVRKWINKLNTELEDGTTMHHLLKLMENDLLVPSERKRKYIRDILDNVKDIHHSCSSNPPYRWGALKHMLTEGKSSRLDIVNEFAMPLSQQVS